MGNPANISRDRTISVLIVILVGATSGASFGQGGRSIQTRNLFYVDAVNGSDSSDGLTRETSLATIQKAIETAENSDTILVYPGLYNGEIDFQGKAITVQGVPEGPAGIPVLNNFSDFAVSFFRSEGPESILKNFVIKDSFMAIFIAGSSPTISNLTIVQNTYGVEAYAGSEPDISNCIFWKNTGGDLFGCQAQYSCARQDVQPVPTEGLIAHWGFDEDQGSIAYDSAGDKNGTIHDAQRTIGPIGGALKFDGENGYVELPQNNPVWLPQDNFSLSVWVYFERDFVYAHDYGEIILDFNYGASADPENELGYNLQRRGESGKICFQMTTTTNSDEDVYSNEILAPNAWHHIVAVRDRDIQAIYINGRLDESRSCSIDPIDYIGGYDDDMVNLARYTTTVPPPRGHFKGAMDEVMVFGRALSAEEIQQLYQNGAGGVGDPLFADPENNDYHLLSERGRYWPEHDIWVLDRVTSPCIDGGDPNVEPVDEPIPNGGRINMGAYGGTFQASLSPDLLPGKASNPRPANGAVDVEPDINLRLSWDPGSNAVLHDVYFGTENPPPFVSTQAETHFEPWANGQWRENNQWSMRSNTTYYWRVDEVDSRGNRTVGTLWEFTTGPVPPPKGRACFVEETVVWVNGTLTPISTVGRGWVIGPAQCGVKKIPSPAAPCQGKVEQVQEHEGIFECYDVLLESGNCVTVAEQHYFLTESGKWVGLRNLRRGARLQTATGSIAIANVAKRSMPYIGKVYNLKIKDSDRYLVGKDAVVVRDY